MTMKSPVKNPVAASLFAAWLGAAAAAGAKPSEMFTLTDADRPGGWCWFQDPRAVVDMSDPDKPLLITGVVTWAPKGNDARGDIDCYWLGLESVGSDGPLRRGRFELEDQLEMDDHDSPSFWIRPDGRYLAAWNTHGGKTGTGKLHYRISTEPGNPESWSDIRFYRDGNGWICYTNPHWLAAANDGKGVLFMGVRSHGFDANILYSDDLGETWRYGGRLLDALDPWPEKSDGGRAYVKYAGDGQKRVWIISTDDHPIVNFNDARTEPGENLNSIYAGYIEDGKLHRVDGTVVDENLNDPKGESPTKLTVLLKDGTVVGDAAMRRGWQVDVKTMADGLPVGVFQFRADDNKDDHRYFYFRHDGTKINVHFLAHGGANFAADSQPDYTGLAAVDPLNPDVVFISTDAHPVTGEPLVSTASGQRQHEIFIGRTADRGETWSWEAVTENSPCDNLRPIVPAWTPGKSVVLWMRGTYPKFYEYDTAIVGRIYSHETPAVTPNEAVPAIKPEDNPS